MGEVPGLQEGAKPTTAHWHHSRNTSPSPYRGNQSTCPSNKAGDLRGPVSHLIDPMPSCDGWGLSNMCTRFPHSCPQAQQHREATKIGVTAEPEWREGWREGLWVSV